MTYGIVEIGAGLSIGLQVGTVVILLSIMRKRRILTMPYLLLAIAVLLQVALRVNVIVPFITPHIRILLQVLVSALSMLGFAKILKSLSSQ